MTDEAKSIDELSPQQEWADFIKKLNDEGVFPDILSPNEFRYSGVVDRTQVFPPQTALYFYVRDNKLSCLNAVDILAPEMIRGEIGQVNIDFKTVQPLIPHFSNPALIPLTPIKKFNEDGHDNIEGLIQSLAVTISDSQNALEILASQRDNRRLADERSLWSKAALRTNSKSVFYWADTPEGRIVRSEDGSSTYWFPDNTRDIPSLFYGKDPEKLFSVKTDVGFLFATYERDNIIVFPANVKPGNIIKEVGTEDLEPLF